MKNISAEVSIFCLWTNWIHLVTCSEIEFCELHCCSRCALDKIFEIYTFDRCPQGWSGQKLFLACGDAKKENWRTTKLLLKHVSYTLFMGKNKRKLFPDGKSRVPLLARAALNYLCDSRRNEMDHNLVGTPSNSHVNNHTMSQIFYKIASDACLQFQYHCQGVPKQGNKVAPSWHLPPEIILVTVLVVIQSFALWTDDILDEIITVQNPKMFLELV